MTYQRIRGVRAAKRIVVSLPPDRSARDTILDASCFSENRIKTAETMLKYDFLLDKIRVVTKGMELYAPACIFLGVESSAAPDRILIRVEGTDPDGEVQVTPKTIVRIRRDG